MRKTITSCYFIVLSLFSTIITFQLHFLIIILKKSIFSPTAMQLFDSIGNRKCVNEICKPCKPSMRHATFLFKEKMMFRYGVLL